MKKILKRGFIKVMKCKTCGCEFSYEKEDVVRKQAGPIEYDVYVVCPQCERECFIRSGV